MGMQKPPIETAIIEREGRLRQWFTRDCDEIRAVIDGLDIGLGGVQRWATTRMPPPIAGPHLDIACGYGTFLAQLGWRFPFARLVGLNIDYAGPHAQIRELLAQAEVRTELVQADAREMPFADGIFASASCFLGLQDIEIGFGQVGVRDATAEAVRVLRPGGVLSLLDEFPFERFDVLLAGQNVTVLYRGERELDTRWYRETAERAIELYAEGWVTQARATDPTAEARLLKDVHSRMAAEMERQFSDQGCYIPFGPVRMVVARKG
jgi:SAM-dependent methyltransferase